MQTHAGIPATAPFSSDDIRALDAVVARATREQRAWLSGFLAGLDVSPQQARPAAPPQARTPLTLLYASDSGNAEALALAAKAVAARQGFDARVHDMADVDVGILAKAKNLLVYAATWGEGEPPDRAAEFYDALMSDAAPDLAGVRFGVLALGDSAYVNFCETGKRIDERLAALGAERAVERIDLDLDFAAHAPGWTDAGLAKLKPADAAKGGAVVHVDFQPPGEAAAAFTQAAPLEAEIAALVNLSGTGSTRETWHAELLTDAPGFAYQPGDSIGVMAENHPDLVRRVVEAAGVEEDADLVGQLTRERDITTLSRLVAEKYAAATGREDLAALAADADAFAGFAGDRQLLDLFTEFPAKLTAETLTGLLRPLPPRYYSVASSPLAHPGEAHILVGAVRWRSHDLDRHGVASTHIADRRKVGDGLKVFVKANKRFRLPTDGGRPIVMIGAGTGVAPYRGFVAEREAAGARGKSWLIFGERNFTHDFLYQLDWQGWLANGALARIDVAFSRDQKEKIYVQHRLWQARDALRGWLAEGAHLYVCGDEQGMARDVDATLARILAEPEGGDAAAGKAMLGELAKAGRYQRDVY